MNTSDIRCQWVEVFLLRLENRWPFLPRSSLSLVAYQAWHEEPWYLLQPDRAADDFIAETEFFCWIQPDAEIYSRDETKKIVESDADTDLAADGELAVRALKLREQWRAAGFPDDVIPKKFTITAICQFEKRTGAYTAK